MNGEELRKVYKTMLLIRRFEQEAAKSYTERKIGGFLHLYIGQEAVATGVIAACKPEDYIIASYRDHAHYLARGGDVNKAMAELYGKSTGCSGGRGGSMHFFDSKNNFMGGHGIVGAHIPLAAGLAFAQQYRHESGATVCFFGEGATSIGPFHEGLCLAALWNLPVVFVIENNGYAMGTPQKRQMVLKEAATRALGYPMARKSVEGVDVVECFEVAREALTRAKEEGHPTLLEFNTYRYRGHSMADPAKYRTKKEVDYWRNNKDPLTIARQRLERDFPGNAFKLNELEVEVEAEVLESVRFAEASPEPDESTLEEFTYV